MPAPKKLKLEAKESRQDILDAIRNGGLTPFLGAGASSLRPEELGLAESPWREMKQAILAMRSALAGQQPRSDEAYLYLRSFTEQRLRIAADKLESLFPINRFGRPHWTAIKRQANGGREWPSPALLRFQCAVLRVAADLGTIFGHAFSTSYPSISDCCVTMKPTDPRYEGMIGHLLDLVDAAAAKELTPEQSAPLVGDVQPPRLKVGAIRQKLLVLTVELMTETKWDSPELSEWQKRHEKAITELPEEDRRPSAKIVTVRLSRLEWLSDLVWYSLRFWIPLYPTTAELAFELSLAVSSALPRRAELAQAAEALFLDHEDLVKQMEPLFTFCEQSQERPTDFHLAIAAVLQQMYAKYVKRDSSKRDSRGHPHRPTALPPDLEEPDLEEQTGYIPIAFTTNFDRALEKAFEYKRLRLAYHVVYPGRTVFGDKRGEVRWFFKTYLPELSRDKDFQPLKLCEDDLAKEKIRGPVIVKLHGSPLDTLLKGYEHWVVLSESGYLEAMDPKMGPAWLEKQLLKLSGQPPRSLWFLGYSVADWNIRLRLYEHLRHYSNVSKDDLPSKSVIERGALDWFSQAIFGNLAIHMYQGNLNSLPRIIRSALSAVGMPQFEEVQRIVQQIGREAS